MNIESYQAAYEQAVYLDRSAAGCVELKGRDRLALIHRLSTNAVERLAPGEGAQTVLTNHNARIIDALLVLAIDEDTAWVVTTPGRGPQIAGQLAKNIFFNDQLTVRDCSEPTSQLHLYGPQATAILERMTGAALADLPLWHHVAAEIDGCSIRLVRIKPINGAGWLILEDMAAIEAVAGKLDEAGAVLLDAATYEALRVESGYPGPPELNLEYIPLEADLWDAVSFKKGCYVGQEIIARMESRGRLAKRLMGLRVSGQVTVPAKLTVDGKDAGDLTSLAMSPRHGPVIGLGFVRTAFAEQGAVLQAGAATAVVAALPFSDDPTT
ncbi:MAG TPA: glycine cleavage T C-terminal barrel domain-containing protein [Herpetosiphonaceae bacterium]